MPIKVLEIELSGLPSLPNIRRHWAVKAKETKTWRSMVAYAVLNQRPLAPLTSVSLTLVRGSSQPTDIDNGIASFKPLIDGLKDGKIIVDDNPNVVKQINYSWEKTRPKQGYVRLTVYTFP